MSSFWGDTRLLYIYVISLLYLYRINFNYVMCSDDPTTNGTHFKHRCGSKSLQENGSSTCNTAFCGTWDSICCIKEYKPNCTKTADHSCPWNQGSSLSLWTTIILLIWFCSYQKWIWMRSGAYKSYNFFVGVLLQVQWSNLCENGEVRNHDKACFRQECRPGNWKLVRFSNLS